MKSFLAALERGGPRRLGWTIARIPFDAAKLWGGKGRLKVRGEINGFVFVHLCFQTARDAITSW
ncbi:MAG: DUF1905 domain-containing protein [Bryobacteraceae bacterium]